MLIMVRIFIRSVAWFWKWCSKMGIENNEKRPHKSKETPGGCKQPSTVEVRGRAQRAEGLGTVLPVGTRLEMASILNSIGV